MADQDDSIRSRWLFALKPASWPKLLVPMALGQAMGIDASGRLSIGGLVVGAGFTLLHLVYVVLLNDFGDREVDAIKRRMFPTTSKKTLPDGVLSPGALLLVGSLAGVAALVLAFVGELTLDRPGLGIAGLAALALFWAYSLPPLRLNYRGGGELLEGVGVGLLLPVLNAYAQSGELFTPSMTLLPGFAALCLASGIASGLSDERSDRRGGKRTFTTLLGNARARMLVEGFSLLGITLWGLAWGVAYFGGLGPASIACFAGASIAALAFPALRRESAAAQTDAFEAQRVYKQRLHAIVWEPSLAFAGFLALGPLLGW